MKLKIYSRSAITLIELLIASVLVGIVTLGLIAAEEAVRVSRQSSHRDSQVSAQLQAAMLKLTNDASLTVGDAVDTGIFVDTLDLGRGKDLLSPCKRRSNTYSDDIWHCWVHHLSSPAIATALYSCPRTYYFVR